MKIILSPGHMADYDYIAMEVYPRSEVKTSSPLTTSDHHVYHFNIPQQICIQSEQQNTQN